MVGEDYRDPHVILNRLETAKRHGVYATPDDLESDGRWDRHNAK